MWSSLFITWKSCFCVACFLGLSCLSEKDYCPYLISLIRWVWFEGGRNFCFSFLLFWCFLAAIIHHVYFGAPLFLMLFNTIVFYLSNIYIYIYIFPLIEDKYLADFLFFSQFRTKDYGATVEWVLRSLKVWLH